MFAGHLGAGLATGCVERRVTVGVFVVAALVAAAAGSHGVLDAIVHRPEMPLAGPGSAALALARWQHMPLALAVEALVAVGGPRLFLRGQPAHPGHVPAPRDADWSWPPGGCVSRRAGWSRPRWTPPRRAHVPEQAPRTGAEQVAFGHARTSPDGRYIGWAAMLPNCCTSYPLPLSIVVHGGERIVRIIGPLAPPAFEWTFSDDSRAVVLKQQFPHGVSPRLFSRVRIRDGAWLGRYECLPDEPDRADAAAPPRWAAPLADECR